MTKTYKTDKPVLGFRSWSLSPMIVGDFSNQVYHLDPIGAGNNHWVPGENIASCLNSQSNHRRPVLAFSGKWRDAPGHNCHCGFNAFNTLEAAEAYNDTSSFAVFGAVAGCGKMQVHDEGWRSEKAQIIALFFRPEKRRNTFDPYAYPVFINNKEYSLDRVSKSHLEDIEKTAKYYRVPLFIEEQEFLDFVEKYAQPMLRRAKPTGILGNRDFKLSLSIVIIAALFAFTNIFALIFGASGEEFLEAFALFMLGFFGARVFIQLVYWSSSLFANK